MKPLLIAVLLFMSLTAQAGPKVSADFAVGQETVQTVHPTNGNTSSRSGIAAPSIGIGYEVLVTDTLAVDGMLKMLGTATGSSAVAEVNGLVRVSDRFTFKAGLNTAYPWAVSSTMSDVSKNAGIGFQIGGEYRLNSKFSVQSQFQRTSQDTVGSVFSAGVKVGETRSNFEQNAVTAGIVFRF